MKYSPAISGRSRRAASSAVPPPPKVRWMLSSEMFSMVAPPTQLSVMQECFSPGFSTLVTLASASCGGSVVTVPWMLLKEMLRRTAGVVVPGGAPVDTSQFAFGLARGGGAPGAVGRGPRGPTLTWMGPVTSCRMRLEKDMFSYREPGLPWNLMGHP